MQIHFIVLNIRNLFLEQRIGGEKYRNYYSVFFCIFSTNGFLFPIFILKKIRFFFSLTSFLSVLRIYALFEC